MRLTAILLLSAALTASASGHTQGITIREKNAPLEKMFKAIEKQTGYTFFFNYAWLKDAKPVSVDVKNGTLNEVLDACFKDQPFSYEVVNKTIVVKQKEKSPNDTPGHSGLDPESFSPPIDIHGRILNEKGEPVIASVQVKGTNKGTTTNDNGEFELKGVDENATLVISGVSIESFEWKINGKTDLVLNARIKTVQGEEVQIMNTGYQQLPKERATGSFGFVNNQQLNRKTGTDIISRLEGVTTGIQFDRRQLDPNQSAMAANNVLIRGLSTLTSDIKSPLIVVDNFPYEGDINNINPNDVENITILKDAAAASIWGARAGNGVIVITTKHSQYNQPFELSLNSNVQVTSKPDLYKYPRMSSSDFIDVEQSLFSKGFYDAALTDPSYPALSPVVEILASQRAGIITQQQATAQIDVLRSKDVRNDFNNYVYRTGVNTQYALNLSGGSAKAKYFFAGGYDKSNDILVGNDYRRVTFRSSSNITPVKNLEINVGLVYTNSLANNNSLGNIGSSNFNSRSRILYPYAQFADASGNALEIAKDYRSGYTDTAGTGMLLDWKFRPLDELHNADNRINLSDILVTIGANYKLNPFLSFSLNYQFEKSNGENRNLYSSQTYYARNLVNLFTQTQGNSITYIIPKGGILDLDHTDLISHIGRGQFNVNKNWARMHEITGIIGGEIRQKQSTIQTQRLYGFDPNKYTSASLDFVNPYPQYGNRGMNTITDRSFYDLLTDRFVSLYGNVAYTYKNRYILSASGRQDAGNVFGIKSNNRWKPLWTTGFGWNISKESFYASRMFPYLRLRATYGYQGNVNNTISPNTIISYYPINNIANLPWAIITNAANPQLAWESIGQANIGVDFKIKERVSATIDAYRKRSINLLWNMPIDPSTGITRVTSNNAGMEGKGIEVSISTVNIKEPFQWNSEIGLTHNTSTVTDYSPTLDKNIPSSYYASSTGLTIVGRKGKSAYPIFSYPFAGLDPSTGDPLGYLGKNVSTNYQSILNQIYDTANLIYHGSSIPTSFGFFNNIFSYKHISLTVSISYAFGYYFRKNTISYWSLVNTAAQNPDYANRWKAPGDEKTTTVPSFVYPVSNPYRDEFYAFSSANVYRGDNIRLQNIKLSYELTRTTIKGLPFSAINVFGNVQNIGIIWRANKAGLDPDYNTGNALFPVPKTATVGVQISL